MDRQNINVTRMAQLMGMNIEMSTSARNWKMTPSSWFISDMGIATDTPMGTYSTADISASGADIVYSPSFVINDPDATPIAMYQDTSEIGVAKKEMLGWTSIYTASANVVPSILRYAAKRAGVFQYTNTEDICYINNTFIGFHPQYAGTITLNLPSYSTLYNVFDDQELPANTQFAIPVVPGNTYLFYRGTRAQWQALGL